MEKRIAYDFSSLKNIYQRPEPLNAFAWERMAKVCNLLKKYEVYHCLPHCKQCCYGAIIMSYTEFNFIMLHIQERWSAQERRAFFRHNVGRLQDNGSFLCPFLQEDAAVRHCRIYEARPLICRVFGTAAAPCQEPIEPGLLTENLFYQAYNLLYYSHNNFIALNLDEEWAIFEAPFALWCLADNSAETREYLRALIEKEKNSFHAVLYDCRENTFFVYRQGERIGLGV
ncbi:MAG: YkgJ family cysteine cluster protein [Dethiobacteria bacterium]|jgi:Fe-S-cluster containining protein